MTDRVLFRCPHCNAKIQAPYRLLGNTRNCPKCQGQILVQVPAPSDADIRLVGLGDETPVHAG